MQCDKANTKLSSENVKLDREIRSLLPGGHSWSVAGRVQTETCKQIDTDQQPPSMA